MSMSTHAGNFQDSGRFLLNIHSGVESSQPAPQATSGHRCTIRIVATIIRMDDLHGITVDYMGARFTAPAKSLIERVDAHMALFELEANIIRPTGRASFLVSNQGHALRVHVQQVAVSEVRV